MLHMSTRAGKPMRPSAKAGGREMYRQLAMDHAADEPDHDTGRDADGSDVLVIPLLPVLLGTRRCSAWRPADLLLSVYDPSFSIEYRFFGLQQSCESPGIFADPSYECGPTRGLPGETEKEEPTNGADSPLLSGLTALIQ